LHGARLSQSHGHERIDRHNCDHRACAGEFAGAPPHFASACGMPRIDIGPAGDYGFHLAGDEVGVPRLLSRNH
jgi:hypothetical protein